MNDFELGGRKFKIGKLNAFKQFHVVRRIAPILSDLLPAIGEIQKVQKEENSKTESEKFDELIKIVSPMLMGLSKLSDKDSEFVLFSLLSCAEVQLGATWTRLSTESMLMVQDMELPALLQVASRSFMVNLSNFFAVLPAVTPGAR
jgi:hypothetical protein